MCQGNYSEQGAYSSQVSGQAKPTAKEASRSLARLMERQLGYSEGHIDQIALRLFVRAYWSRVSLYAHAIHEDRD